MKPIYSCTIFENPYCKYVTVHIYIYITIVEFSFLTGRKKEKINRFNYLLNKYK